MAKPRIIHTARGHYSSDPKAVVRAKNEYGEFTVEFFVGGVHKPEADYFTDDRQDAIITADTWVAGEIAKDVVDLVGV